MAEVLHGLPPFRMFKAEDSDVGRSYMNIRFVRLSVFKPQTSNLKPITPTL